MLKIGSSREITDRNVDLGRRLCGFSTPNPTSLRPTTPSFTKRDASDGYEYLFVTIKVTSFNRSTTLSASRSTRAIIDVSALCSDGIRRPYQMNVVVDVTARSPKEVHISHPLKSQKPHSLQDFASVLGQFASFIQERFGDSPHLMQINVITVGSHNVCSLPLIFAYN